MISKEQALISNVASKVSDVVRAVTQQNKSPPLPFSWAISAPRSADFPLGSGRLPLNVPETFLCLSPTRGFPRDPDELD
jgi:hypothetical protein